MASVDRHSEAKCPLAYPRLPGGTHLLAFRVSPVYSAFCERAALAPVLHQPSCVITVDFDCRRRIRICCDELNLLVPFCNTETDKATTLQWTTAFLKYIQERHGDSLKKVSIHEGDISVPKLCSVKMGIFLMW